MPQTQAEYDKMFGIKRYERNGVIYIGVNGVDAWQYTAELMRRYDLRMYAQRNDREQAESLTEQVGGRAT